MTSIDRIREVRAQLLKRLERVDMWRRGEVMQRWLIEQRTKFHMLRDKEGENAIRYLQEFYLPDQDWSDHHGDE